MCGIAGAAGQHADERRVRRMTDAVAHRGPDDAGVLAADGVVLGHRRLTVIDLSANGHQPMTQEDGSVAISYNGEVFGTAPLRTKLESGGHRFRSRTDTEVILHLYEDEGPNLLRYLNGMFAFAIHDRARRRLLLCRDRLGIKPFFYAIRDRTIYFASELKGIFAGLGNVPALRPEAVGQYLLQGYVTAPDTAYEGVFALPPGHFLDVDLAELANGNVPQPQEYWDAPFTGDGSADPATVVEELRPLLLDAVSLCMVSDVPLGAFLSGGIDSSSVVAAMASASREPVRTFSVALPGTADDESAKARSVADKWRTVHTELDTTSRAVDYWSCVQHFDAPFNCASLLNATLISAAARAHVTVALSGDGGDELFGGYTRYMRIPGAARGANLSPLRQAVAAALPEDVRGAARLRDHLRDDFTAYFTAEHAIPVTAAERLCGASLSPWVARMRSIYERYPADPRTRAMYLDLKTYLPDHVLAKVDSASMSVSLEVRVPLLDYRLVEMAGRIPASLKIRNGTGKWILKQAVAPWLPEALLTQKKVGFDPPLATWLFERDLQQRLEELSAPSAPFREILDGRIVDGWIADLRRGSRWKVPRRAALWGIYQLDRWLQTGRRMPAPTGMHS